MNSSNPEYMTPTVKSTVTFWAERPTNIVLIGETSDFDYWRKLGYIIRRKVEITSTFTQEVGA